MDDIERTEDVGVASTAAERRLAAIVQSSDDAIFSVTADGLIEDWNPAAERLYGFRAGRSSASTSSSRRRRSVVTRWPRTSGA